MDAIAQINNIPLEDVLTALSIRWKRFGHQLSLYEGGKLTGGWKADLKRGIVSDFSNKWRGTWDRISFVSSFLSCSTKEAISWYVKTFGLTVENNKKTMQTNPIEEKWNSLPSLTEEQVLYLSNRNIRASALEWIVKNNAWRIALQIRGGQGQTKSLQSRTIREDDSVRYMVERNTDGDGIFFSGISNSLPYLIVVEGFTDFLSLRQYTTNVVGLVNAKNEEQLSYIKAFSSKYKIFFVPDNDEAWQTTIEKFKEKWIRCNILRLENYWVKDLNELMVNFWIGEDVLQIIFNDSDKAETNLALALQNAKNYKKLYAENGWHLGFSTGYPLIDKYTDGFIRGKTYLIMAYSNQWKTRFAYSLLRNILDLWKRVHFYSLEIDTWMLFLELVWAIKKKTKQEVIQSLETIDISSLEDKVEVYDAIRSLEAIEQNIINEKPDVAFIDFLQNVEYKGNEYEKMTEIALRIQKLAILTGTTIISLSQVSNESRFNEGNDMSPKGSWALFASSDVIFSLWGREWNKYLTIAKNKFWPAWIDLDLMPEYSTSFFTLADFSWWATAVKTSSFNSYRK